MGAFFRCMPIMGAVGMSSMLWTFGGKTGLALGISASVVQRSTMRWMIQCPATGWIDVVCDHPVLLSAKGLSRLDCHERGTPAGSSFSLNTVFIRSGA